LSISKSDTAGEREEEREEKREDGRGKTEEMEEAMGAIESSTHKPAVAAVMNGTTLFQCEISYQRNISTSVYDSTCPIELRSIPFSLQPAAIVPSESAIVL
jgi:hypothetical protein